MESRTFFKHLVKSYRDGNFEETVVSLLNNSSEEKGYTAKVLAALCGVDLDYTSDFITQLKEKILSASRDNKIVIKVKDCSMECMSSNNKTVCQNTCPFEAININVEKHTTYIDDDKCIDCGICIETCPNHNFMDKVEFFSLAKYLQKY